MEAYLGGEKSPGRSCRRAVAKAMIQGTLIPVIFSAATARWAPPEPMDAAAKYFP